LYYSSGYNITANIVDSNKYGIYLWSSTNNNITENNIVNNTEYGMYLDYSGDNEIYHNNFINNNKQAYDHHGFNKWDKGPVIGGNYWSDHVCHGNPSNGTEPYTKIDTDVGAVDHYPFEDPDGWVITSITEIEIKTDKETYSPGDTMNVKICIKNLGQARDVRFGCWLTIPKLGYATVLAYKPMTLPADYDDCFGSSIPIGDWGASGFAGIWGVGLFEPDTGEVIDCDIATWNYKPGVTEQKKMPAEITKEITKEIESVKLPA